MGVTLANRIRPGDGDSRRGTYNGYSNHRCHCALCRAANVEFVRAARARRASVLSDDDPRHGKATTYSNYSCRCRPCTDAHCAAAKNKRAAS